MQTSQKQRVTQKRAPGYAPLNSGNVWCTGCGEPVLDQPCYDRCLNCFAMSKDPKFCKKCGEKLEPARVAYATKVGGTIRYCTYCSKRLKARCTICLNFHPTNFNHDF